MNISRKVFFSFYCIFRDLTLYINISVNINFYILINYQLFLNTFYGIGCDSVSTAIYSLLLLLFLR